LTGYVQECPVRTDIISGCVWHITHRCHKQEFLLKFVHDRKRYLYWLFEAKKRYGLKILDFMVTSNHIHLLVLDSGEDVIPRSLQLIAGRTAQEHNQRKTRKGAFWEDRYHATAIQTGNHLHCCITYIDLNMVRTGKVTHPSQWPFSGYHEIQCPPSRYALIDRQALMNLCGFSDSEELSLAHQQWIDEGLGSLAAQKRQADWSESVAVGSACYLEDIKGKLRKLRNREVVNDREPRALHEPAATYNSIFDSKNAALSPNNTNIWSD